ncbi:MAG TPA: ImmA/IrrE family metallo-endopeptidase [Clostridiales bacterium]|nr:ImmA/IrrE family metallo-endopeptidase [Clostridiales bacterium]
MLGFYAQRTMEVKARQVIEQYCPECVADMTAIPIEKLIEAFGLEIDYQYLTKNGDKILGKLICSNGITPYYDMDEQDYLFLKVSENTILVEVRLLEQENQGRYRFTLAHELAHWILHKEKIKSEVAYDDSQSDKAMEYQADYFASVLLMPLPVIKRFFHYYAMKKNLTRTDKIELMANQFGVSKQAMEIRLTNHKLI